MAKQGQNLVQKVSGVLLKVDWVSLSLMKRRRLVHVKLINLIGPDTIRVMHFISP